MARHFAYRMQEEAGKKTEQQIMKGYELMLYKPISQAKLSLFKGLYDRALRDFKNDRDKTCEMIGMNDQHNNPETAALVVVANAMLNLDEIVTKW